MPEFNVALFLVGCCGGLLPDIMRIIKNKTDKDVFKNLGVGKPNYWIILVLQVLLGGFTAYILSTASAKDALIVGYTAPEVIGALVAKPDSNKKEEEEQPPAEKRRIQALDELGEAPAAAPKKKFKVRAWLAM